MDIKLKDFKVKGIEHFNSIAEYGFSIFRFILFYEDLSKEEIYIKKIQAGKIKESIFCYWYLLRDKYCQKNNIEIANSPLAVIIQKDKEDNLGKITLELNVCVNYNVKLNLVKLKYYIEKNNIIEGGIEKFNLKSEDILFIGRKKR